MAISSDDNYDLFEQEKADTIPEWMADAGGTTVPSEMVTSFVDEEQPNDSEDVPDWVQEDVSSSWIEEDNSIIAEPPVDIVEEKTKQPAAKKKKKASKKPAKKRKKQAQNYNIALIGLIGLAVLVGMMLIYVLFS